MSTVTNLLKGAAAVGAVAFSLSFTADSASAMNASEFKKACEASTSTICISNKDGTRGTISDADGNQYNVACNSHTCVARPRGGQGGGGGSPARVAPKDKTLGTGVGLAGLLMGQSPSQPKKLDAGQRMPTQVKVDAPKLDTPKAVKIETPKVSVPASTVGKDVKVNVVR